MKNMRWIFALLLIPMLGCASNANRDLEAQRSLINEAAATVTRLSSDPEFTRMQEYIKEAKAVLIIPSMYRAGFVLGAEYGKGVLMVRTDAMGQSDFVQTAPSQNVTIQELDNSNGYTPPELMQPAAVSAPSSSWGSPVFYNLTGGSAGLQIGAQSAEIIITIMTDKGLEGLLNNSLKLGADASVAFGPVGKNIAAGTTLTPPSADMYTFGSTTGLFGGATLGGAVLSESAEWNMLVYGANVDPRTAMLGGNTMAIETSNLRQALNN